MVPVMVNRQTQTARNVGNSIRELELAWHGIMGALAENQG